MCCVRLKTRFIAIALFRSMFLRNCRVPRRTSSFTISFSLSGGMAMKTWTMPRIVVDQFRPNEYVASCKGLVTYLTPGAKYHWDVYKAAVQLGPFVISPEAWDKPDGEYQADIEEKFNVATNHASTGRVTVDSDVPLGSYHNIPVYSSTNYPDGLIDYFDVYVYSSNHVAYVYEAGTLPLAGTPSSDKSFAS